MVPLFPIMIALTLLIIILQVRSLSAMVMVFLTAPLGLIGVVPTLLLFNQPFGINALVGLIALSGILMRNTLILIGQIHHNQQAGLDPFHAVVEATVQRARPVLLTALAAILAFIPLTHSVFWGTLAYTLIGGTLGGNHHDPYLPAGHVRDLVPHPSGEHGTTDRVAPSEVIPLCRTWARHMARTGPGQRQAGKDTGTA
ncbi:RND transporter hydrophobe/amphiphile efflux-1 (HAE1) family [Klebsiella pneumoniae]|nr:RND transporter hydrophobe/amphiphile efflux-1 (HAE1) family [Klebsiella pneumoniae]